ncbi:MAG: hypothetical protein KF862_17745 [Chitinophagaceae bacterium]|nr:hypothetical protein [Chitinophagaceae bacterium]
MSITDRIYLLCKLHLLFLASSLCACKTAGKAPVNVSGIYPQLAYYNNEGECGTGAVVPWAGRLWVVTYAPHGPLGSSDKLYEITGELNQIVRPESIGGTPANRMIHKESNQLFIGPYAIDSNRNVRVIPYTKMPGRPTGNARHLFDPAKKIYHGTMEEGFYEVDVNTLEAKLLYEDRNVTNKKIKDGQDTGNTRLASLYGVHGKGLYSGQGVVVYSNNGEDDKRAPFQFDIEAGSLSEWNGSEWKLVRRNQFTEVTGPGGIFGNKNPVSDPIWATGWDHKSVILGVRDAVTGWRFFRLPKASHSYDGAHGWNTEWPRIRNIGTDEKPELLMTMHGMFWHFPETFSANHTAGIRPRSAYLKVIGDFTRWNNQLVFGCDDAAKNEFLNKRKQKGGIEGAGQSNSNLWFTPPQKPDELGPASVSGMVWLKEEITAGKTSEPMLFAGWEKRMAWVSNQGTNNVVFSFEVNKTGDQNWQTIKTLPVKPGETADIEFSKSEAGEWIRVKTDLPAIATVSFNYSPADNREDAPSTIFNGFANVKQHTDVSGGLLYALGDDRRALGIAAVKFENNRTVETGYYELDAHLTLSQKEDPKTNAFIKEKFAIPENVIQTDASSVLIIDDKNRRWRLPLSDPQYKDLTDAGLLRICREVATERDLFHASGTFYELPAENADGFAKIRPIASHHFRIHDYASYRGMLVMTGIDLKAKHNEHIVRSKDGQAAVWLGVIDDLWKLGKPSGHGGPWKNSGVTAGAPSDPYLIGFYDKRSLEISHTLTEPVTFSIEVDPVGHAPWMRYKEITVQPGEVFRYEFPGNFQARWIRFVANKNCNATAWLTYE